MSDTTYKVLQDGVSVPVYYARVDANGRNIPLVECTVASAGDLFKSSDLSPSLVADLEAGEKKDMYGPADAEVDDQDRARDNARRASSPAEKQSVETSTDGAEVTDADAGGTDLTKLSVDDLKELVEKHDLEVVGTGANGNTVRADLEKAIADFEDAGDPDGGSGD